MSVSKSVSSSSDDKDVTLHFAFGHYGHDFHSRGAESFGQNGPRLFLCRWKSSLWRRGSTCQRTTKIKHTSHFGIKGPFIYYVIQILGPGEVGGRGVKKSWHYKILFRYLINGHAHLFVFEKSKKSFVSTDFHVIKQFFRLARLF